MTFIKVIDIALFKFEFSTVLIILSFVEINGKSIFLLTNILFLIFPLMHRL
jgi:hypothetical protein